jgi:predicted nucleic acid-binding protein
MTKVLVDTCIWSEALRKAPMSPLSPLVEHLTRLVRTGNAVLIGMIRQEILSGIHQRSHFEWVRGTLRSFDDFPIQPEDHEVAAEFFTLCRAKGIQGSHVDFLLAALSVRHQMPIFTTDKDFDLFSKHLKIHLYRGA